MDYLKVSFAFGEIEEYQKDLFIADLADIDFETFEDTTTGFDAFVQKSLFSEVKLQTVLAEHQSLNANYEIEEVVSENWNEEWESNFSPLIITNDCYVRATFHEAQPQYQYEIVIDPKMSFGTGHHQTTTMMMQYILETDFTGKSVLDMGAGTAILGILAAKRGAKDVVAIDYDEVCYESAIENAKLNDIDNLVSLHGSKEAIPQQDFDIILANINRNILLDQIETYVSVLKKGGLIFFSGFYETPDLDIIKLHCEQFGLTYQDHKKIDNWVSAKFIK
ncbi:50S ribosomal protein L11 methyltransferase [Pedobacter sp. SL55]|uniref:50S ribosomal protein L11 methyltransferase n=1 Tax=Pedobacter sp. SL55 TaxID=2995161 RepID=UPI00226EE84B|nr:50S ribosomal protein L11 methyltransferase [Pedobacter sp. SL55]WAC39288.1 50S ribosomal protein L11 methyltransferase [Pedobacter sp. SL55]